MKTTMIVVGIVSLVAFNSLFLESFQQETILVNQPDFFRNIFLGNSCEGYDGTVEMDTESCGLHDTPYTQKTEIIVTGDINLPSGVSDTWIKLVGCQAGQPQLACISESQYEPNGTELVINGKISGTVDCSYGYKKYRNKVLRIPGMLVVVGYESNGEPIYLYDNDGNPVTYTARLCLPSQDEEETSCGKKNDVVPPSC